MTSGLHVPHVHPHTHVHPCACVHTQNLRLSEKLVFVNINPELNGTHVS